LLSAQRMSPAKISEVVFTDPDTVREVIHNFNRDGVCDLEPGQASIRPRRGCISSSTTSAPPRR
jgi:hypothetical protein